MERRDLVKAGLGAALFAASSPATAASRFLTRAAHGAGRALPLLPLAAGARVALLGHSYVVQNANAPTPAAPTLAWLQRLPALGTMLNAADQRFNLDHFKHPDQPYGPERMDGFQHGISGSGFFSSPTMDDRLTYVLARHPHVLIIDSGCNDIGSRAAAEIIARYDGLLERCAAAGVWTVPCTQAAFRSPLWTAAQEAENVRLNAWIVAQQGRPGVAGVMDFRALDGLMSVGDGYFGDSRHLNNKGWFRRLPVALATMQAIVQPGNWRGVTDPLASNNIFPRKGLPGVAGSVATGVTGVVATNMSVSRSRGASTYACTKEVIATGNEKQVIAATAVNDGTVNHAVRLRVAGVNPGLFSGLGLTAGDWLRASVKVELDDWSAWLIDEENSTRKVGVAALSQYNSGAQLLSLQEAYTGLPNRSFWLEIVQRIEPGADRFLNCDVSLYHRSDAAVAGTSGVARISEWVWEKLAVDPRVVWNLTA